MDSLGHNAEPSAVAPRRTQPHSRADLFWSFSVLALQGFGGVAAVAQRELVDRKQWLSREEFVEDWAVAQILPGPNVINLSLMIGDRAFGLSGALAGLAGMVAIPLLLVLALAAVFAGVSSVSAVQGALRGMGGVTAGLIAANSLKLISSLETNAMGMGACWLLAALTFAAVALLRVPLLWVLVMLGGIAWAWAYHQLGLVKARGAGQ